MSKVKTIRWVQFASGAAAALLILPAAGSARAMAAFAQQADAAQSSQQDQDNQNGNQNSNEREERERDRQEAERERQQEAKDREQEARDRVQERADRLEEIYDDARSALDDDKYERARDKFSEVIEANGPQADAALYWKAYAQQHLGQRDAALSSIADLKKRFPQSRWQKDASALEIEIRQGTGHPSRPEIQGDEELKMLAIQSLMNSDPERAMPLLEKVLQGSATPKEKSKASVRAGAERFAARTRNHRAHRQGSEQSGIATQSDRISGYLWRSGSSQDHGLRVYPDHRGFGEAFHSAQLHDRRG